MQLKIEELYQIYKQHPVIVTDSRKISRGCLFFALKGDNFNGNTFAAQALNNGAAYAVIDQPEYEMPGALLVDDVLQTLQQLASFHRTQWKFPVIGITGTNGKTTTKELVHAVLSRSYQAHATSGNLNNHIGVPLTLFSAPASTNIAIIEMGANHPGEIAQLSGIANPDYGLITNIGKAHLEGFGGFEGVIKTKSELYRHLKLHEGRAFVNGNNPLLVELAADLTCTFYGNGESFHTRGSVTETDPFLSVQWMSIEGAVTINTRLTGEYNFENVMAAICVGTFFGVPSQDIKAAIEDYTPTNSRSQTCKTDRNTLILDAYNANPTSMQAAIRNLSKMKAKEKMAILGDMLELGADSSKEHEAIVNQLKELQFNQVILVGPEFSQVAKGVFLTFPDSVAALHWLSTQHFEGYTILIKGSRGIKMETVLEAL